MCLFRKLLHFMKKSNSLAFILTNTYNILSGYIIGEVYNEKIYFIFPVVCRTFYRF